MINRNFKIVYQPKPKDRHKYGGRRRFFISGNKLAAYIGEENAADAIDQALSNTTKDVKRCKYRSRGWVDFYNK